MDKKWKHDFCELLFISERRYLNVMEDTIGEFHSNLSIATDLNTRAGECKMPQLLHTYSRDKLLLEIMARLGLLLLNRGNTLTYFLVSDTPV